MPLHVALDGVATALIGVGALIGFFAPEVSRGALAVAQVASRLITLIGTGEAVFAWDLALAALALAAAAWLARRGRRALALYLGIFGTLHLFWELTWPGRPLGALAWRGWEMADFWRLLLLTGVELVWLARRQLTSERVARLLFLGLIALLLRQTSFIESPFSPFLGYVGIGFLAIGIVWDALTAGEWANVGSPALLCVNRIYLYLGYTLLTATLVNYFQTAHDLSTIEHMTGGIARVGLDRFGRPMLYAVCAATLAKPPSPAGPAEPVARAE